MFQRSTGTLPTIQNCLKVPTLLRGHATRLKLKLKLESETEIGNSANFDFGRVNVVIVVVMVIMRISSSCPGCTAKARTSDHLQGGFYNYS